MDSSVLAFASSLIRIFELSSIILFANSTDPAAADHNVTIVHNHGLALRDRPLGFIKTKMQLAILCLPGHGRFLFVTITYLCLYANWLRDLLTGNQIYVFCRQFSVKQVFIFPQHNAIGIRTDVSHIDPATRRQFQPAVSLSSPPMEPLLSKIKTNSVNSVFM